MFGIGERLAHQAVINILPEMLHLFVKNRYSCPQATLHNVTSAPRTVEVSDLGLAGAGVAVDVLDGASVGLDGPISLGPYGVRWLQPGR